MTKTICLDFGNTRQKIALFEDKSLKEILVLDQPFDQVNAFIQQHKPQISILSSVINHSKEIEELLASKTKFHKLSNESKLPFTIPVGKPETVGADRLAIAAASVFLFPNKK